MTVGADNHHRLLHLLRVGRFHHIYNVKVTQGGITIFPGDTATLPLDLLRYRLGYVLEVLRIVKRLGGNATEDHKRSHVAPPMQSAYPKPSVCSLNRRSAW